MKKDLGAILFIAGTTIGAGMLALPAVTSPLGLLLALGCYLLVFFIMLVSAKYFLDVVLHFKEPHNFVELAKKTLGKKGQALCWIIYLLLMYALIAAYISAAASMLSSFLPKNSLLISESSLILLLPIIFAAFLGCGLKGLDHLNRLLMLGLITSFIMLAAALSTSASFKVFYTLNLSSLKFALPIVITSFGYHIIIPTLTTYLEKDKKRILRALIYGSTIPLIIYIFWHLIVYFNLTQDELNICLKSDVPITDVLAKINPRISKVAFIFALLAILTSFLGVALSLFDFLKDSLPQKALFKNKKILFTLTFLPPIIYIFYFKKAFYLALDHAGILVSILLIMLPALMHLKISKKSRYPALLLIGFSFYVIIADIMQKMT
jgi:tyrosine-specific transport protein